jgi:hypothetical protein
MPRTDDSLSPGLESAFAEETRRGAMLAIALFTLWSVLLATAAIFDLYRQRGVPSFFGWPPEIL